MMYDSQTRWKANTTFAIVWSIQKNEI